MKDATNEAIRLACEKGGYRWSIDVTLESMLLDPKWWQALGKARGWAETHHTWVGWEGRLMTEWEYHWHTFVDHLASGKNAEEFFTNLLK